MDAKDHPFTMHSLSLLLPQGSFICQDTNWKFKAWAPRLGGVGRKEHVMGKPMNSHFKLLPVPNL